jgi:hypothetical protein
MSRIVERINHVAPDISDLTTDQPTTCRWLPTDVTPVLNTPVLVGLGLMAVNWLTGPGEGCLVDDECG